jgi:hypothetical protein
MGQLGEELGVSRERVRELVLRSRGALERRLSRLTPILDLIESRAAKTPTVLDATTQNDFLAKWRPLLYRLGVTGVDDTTIHQLITAIRTVRLREKEQNARWPRTTFAACLIDPPLRDDTRVASFLEAQDRARKDETRTLTYEELAENVLRTAYCPLHWSEIADRAEALNRHPNFSRSGFYRTFSLSPQKFARVGPGTYALRELGYETISSHTDAIAAFLRESGTTRTDAEISSGVQTDRQIKPATLKMLLNLHVRFFRSIDGSYGLRAWLQPREKQSLRTPPSLVEAADSHQRLAVALSRGYNVDQIVARDRETIPSNLVLP